MARLRKNEILVGLDIGSSKVCAIVGETTPDGEIDILGVGTSPSTGVRKGVIVDIEQTSQAILKAIEEAEMMAGCSIRSVYVNVSGCHIQSTNNQHVVTLRDRIVQERDIQNVLEGARTVLLPQDREAIHLLPQSYLLDGQDGIIRPLGMSGLRLEAKAHLVTASSSFLQNLRKCVENCNLHVSGLVLDSIASCEAILNEDEKDLGVVLIDIGAGTTDIAILEGGSIIHTAVLARGGELLTNELASSLRTPTSEAEGLKLRHGCARPSHVDPNDIIHVPRVGGRRPQPCSRQFLAELIEANVEELFRLIRSEIHAFIDAEQKRSRVEKSFPSGIVLTGGYSHLDGICELAEEVTQMPVRKGYPTRIGGIADIVRSPRYSTAVGLLLYSLRHPSPLPPRRALLPGLSVAWERARSWLTSFF